MSSAYQEALDAGYSEEEIQSFLSKKDPKFQEALDAGYSTQEISDYLSKKSKPKESLGANIGRQAGRTGARVAETVLGAPRAVGEFVESLVPEKIITKGAEKIGLGEPVKKGFELSKKYAPFKLFPKSEDIRENVTKHLFGEKLEPKNEWEKKADEFFSDFAALALPLPGSQFKLLKPGLLAVGGNIASDVVGRMGGSEKEKTWAKLGTILAGSLINPKAAQNLKKDLFAKAREARPVDAKVDAFKLQQNIKNYRTQLQKGGSAPYKNAALKKLDELEEAAKSGDIRVDELENFKITTNSLRSGLYEEFKGNAPGRKLAKDALDKVSNIIDQGLDVYGFSNPEWQSFYRPANEVHGAIAQSYRVRNAISRHAKKLGFPALVAELGLVHAVGAPAAISAAGGAAAALGTGELMARVMKSPTLRKHYLNLVNGALKDDVVVMRENLRKLDEELKKQKD